MKMHMASTVLGPRRRLPALVGGPSLDSVKGADSKSLPKSKSIRWHLVERVKREIAKGTYDTEEKMDRAIDRFLEQYGI